MTTGLRLEQVFPSLAVGGVGFGQEAAGRGLIGRGDQHTDAFQLELRVLAAGVVGQDGGPQAVAAEHARDQLGLRGLVTTATGTAAPSMDRLPSTVAWGQLLAPGR